MMQSILFLFAAVLILFRSFVSAETHVERALTCGALGYDGKTKAYFASKDVTLAALSGCGARCKGDNKCLSFAVGKSMCYNYVKAVSGNFNLDPSSPYKFYDKACSVPVIDQCGIIGYEKSETYLLSVSTKAADLAWFGCSGLCRKNEGCKSYAVGKKSCRLYKSRVTGNFNANSTSPFKFYDLACHAPATASQSSTKRTSSTVPSSTIRTNSGIPSSSRAITTSSSSVKSSSSRSTSLSSRSSNTSSSVRTGSVVSSVFSSMSISTDINSNSVTSSIIIVRSSTSSTTSIRSATSSRPTTSTTSSSSSSNIGSPTGSTSNTVTTSSQSSRSSQSSSQSTIPSTSQSALRPSSTQFGLTSLSTSAIITSKSTPTDASEFTRTYTYEDKPLPTVTFNGSAPVTTPLPQPSVRLPADCWINPDEAGLTFQLSEPSQRIPIVQRSTTTLGKFPAPQSQAEADALGPAESYTPPSFRFNADGSGLHDLVLITEPVLYVGKTATGQVILTRFSTGRQGAIVNGQKVVTTMFNATCRNRITVTEGGQNYDWTISGDSTLMTTTSSIEGSMYLLPNRVQTVQRLRRKSLWNEGQVPRCPNIPPVLVSKVRPDARGLNPNGCGPADGIDLIPDYTFGECCDGHDNCFDDCNGKTFEMCNSEFRNCLRTSGCAKFDEWRDYDEKLGCLMYAELYAWAVTTAIGRKAFRAATAERCGCYCPDGQVGCYETQGSLTCVNVQSDDVNNCGACGRKCPTGSKCAAGKCVCDNDQCGDRCVNLKDHPRNCGACGNVCSSGYCFNGQCYAPPSPSRTSSTSTPKPTPTACNVGYGFTNGGFDYGLSDWTWADQIPYYGNTMSIGLDDPNASSVNNQIALVSMNGDPRDSRIIMDAWVKVCPGVRYVLSFRYRHFEGAGYCEYGILLGKKLVHSQARFGLIEQGWLTYPPLAVPIMSQADGKYVTAAGSDLYAQFEFIVACTQSGRMVFGLDDFVLAVGPVQP